MFYILVACVLSVSAGANSCCFLSPFCLFLCSWGDFGTVGFFLAAEKRQRHCVVVVGYCNGQFVTVNWPRSLAGKRTVPHWPHTDSPVCCLIFCCWYSVDVRVSSTTEEQKWFLFFFCFSLSLFFHFLSTAARLFDRAVCVCVCVCWALCDIEQLCCLFHFLCLSLFCPLITVPLCQAVIDLIY